MHGWIDFGGILEWERVSEEMVGMTDAQGSAFIGQVQPLSIHGKPSFSNLKESIVWRS